MKHTVVRARAPLRLGLAGGGTDVAPYSETYGGVVLNVTVDLYASVTIERRSDGLACFVQNDRLKAAEEVAAARLDIVPGDPHLLAKGVYNRMCALFNDGAPLSATIYTHADVPPGSGLGTSSALVVALVEAFRLLLQAPLSPYEVAHLAYEIERVDLAQEGGKQDQYAAAFGGVNFIEFGPGDKVLVNPLRIPRATLAELESSLVLFFSGVSRDSATIIRSQSASIRKGEQRSLDAMHALKRGAFEMKEALLRGHVKDLAAILEDGWANKKKTAASIANSFIDEIYETAKSAGALGGKVSGAGGGGFLFFLTEPSRRQEVVRALSKHEGLVLPARLTSEGAFAWIAG